jgi:hypothetical protein
MIPEYSKYLLDTASLCKKFGGTFSGVKFDERTQAIEVFVLQALSMCASHCSASAILLQNDYAGEAATILRSIEELLFNIRWINEPKEREERLERVYRLEADPYSRWDKETKLIGRKHSAEKEKSFRGPIDAIAEKYTYLTQVNADGLKSFKTLNVSLAERMGESLRPLYYHIYCYGSIFTHPTPYIKELYLKMSDSDRKGIESFDESHKQFIAYTLMFVGKIVGYVEGILGPYSPSSKEQRDVLLDQIIQSVDKANNGYFHFRKAVESENERPS